MIVDWLPKYKLVFCRISFLAHSVSVLQCETCVTSKVQNVKRFITLCHIGYDHTVQQTILHSSNKNLSPLIKMAKVYDGSTHSNDIEMGKVTEAEIEDIVQLYGVRVLSRTEQANITNLTLYNLPFSFLRRILYCYNICKNILFNNKNNVNVTTDEFLTKLLIWIFLCEYWPTRMSHILAETNERNDSDSDVSLFDYHKKVIQGKFDDHLLFLKKNNLVTSNFATEYLEMLVEVDHSILIFNEIVQWSNITLRDIGLRDGDRFTDELSSFTFNILPYVERNVHYLRSLLSSTTMSLPTSIFAPKLMSPSPSKRTSKFQKH